MAIANADLRWPNPSDSQLENLADFINDVNSLGLQVILYLGNPGVIPNSKDLSSDPSKRVHVGGHKAGETINGTILYWDVPYYGVDYIDLAKQWHSKISNYLYRNLKNKNGITYLAINGCPFLPFATELCLMNDNNFAKISEFKNYMSSVTQTLADLRQFPVGVSTYQSVWKDDAYKYDFLDNLKTYGIIDKLTYIDITSYTGTKVDEIIKRIGERNRKKVILSDFQCYQTASDQGRQKYNDPIIQRNCMQSQADLTSYSGLAGWWIWQYRSTNNMGQAGMDVSYFINSGLRDGDNWRTPLLDVVTAGPLKYENAFYYINSEKFHCLYPNIDAYKKMTCRTNLEGIITSSSLPRRMPGKQLCHPYNQSFMVNNEIYYENAERHYCKHSSLESYFKITGEKTTEGLMRFPSIPGGAIYDGICNSY